MGVSKIQDEAEAVRWYEEGVTYEEMVRRYVEKYNIQTTPSMWGNFRRRRGLERRIARDDELIPWAVNLEHRHDYPILMLRKEARRRAGMELSPEDEHAVNAWLEGMKRDNVVLHYDGETDKGWFYVEPRAGIDTDIIRVPPTRTGRRAAD